MERKLVYLGTGVECLAVGLSKKSIYFTERAEIITIEDENKVNEINIDGFTYEIYSQMCEIADKIDESLQRSHNLVNKGVSELNPRIGDLYMVSTRKSDDISLCYLLYLGSSSMGVEYGSGDTVRTLDGPMFMLFDDDTIGSEDKVDLSKLLSRGQTTATDCFSFRFMLKSGINMRVLSKVGKLELRGPTSVSWREVDKRYYLTYRRK